MTVEVERVFPGVCGVVNGSFFNTRSLLPTMVVDYDLDNLVSVENERMRVLSIN
jgi:hypothetical protein